MNGKDTIIIENVSVSKKEFINPFPGLRPFTFEESHLFFGREGHCDEILLKLTRNHFVALVGTSGSGKSSLMYCGLLPILYGGFVTQAGSNWKVFVSRPGISPIENLAESIYLDGRHKEDVNEQELLEGKTVISSILHSSSLGLVDVVKQKAKSENQNILVVVDQFEELFRLYKENNSVGNTEEVTSFVNLLTEAVSHKDCPIYIAITLRSDFIGESSKFPALTKLVNNSHYLIPQLNRDQQKLAIEGPVAVGGAKISKRLVQQLLNDLSNKSNQLPVMQHALMRTWDYWVKNHEPDEPIDLRHYNVIGKINEALSLHADETYNELSAKEKEICEVIFKSLTEKGRENYGVRRPCSINEIANIAMVSEEAVKSVVDKFRQSSRSLLMPAANVPLHSDTIIEISHESLMRIWERLKVWVDEEAESAQMYLRLSEAAEMYQVGRTGLWRPPDLQLALNWQKKQKPTYIWAKRYNPLFERAMVFLDTSKKAYESEQKSQALMQKRRMGRIKMVSLILGFAAVISILFFIFAIMKKMDADEKALEASINAQRAQENAQQAENNAQRATMAALEAEQQKNIAEERREEADSAKRLALINAEEARIQAERAEERTAFAENQKKLADQSAVEANRQKEIANQNAARAQRLRMLSIAQSMSVKSLQVRDENLKGNLAMKAYLFNMQFDGEKYDNYVYDGLYYALKSLYGDSSYYKMNAHIDAVRSVIVSNNNVFSTGSDGRIVLWKLDNYQNGRVYTIFENDFVNRSLKLSADNRWLINAGMSNEVQVFDLNSKNKRPIKIEGHNGFVYDIVFLPNNDYFLTSSADSTIRLNDYSNSRVLLNADSEIKTLSITPDGKILAGGNDHGEVNLWYTDNQSSAKIKQSDPIHVVEFSHSGETLAIGDESGNVTLYSLKNGIENPERLMVLTGHHSRINDISFNDQDSFLATAGFDGRIQLWTMEDLDKLPIVMRDHESYVWSLDFSDDSDYLVAGGKDGTIKIWPTDPNIFANQLCPLLKRNMTKKEWERYVAPDIDYQTTCPNLMIN